MSSSKIREIEEVADQISSAKYELSKALRRHKWDDADSETIKDVLESLESCDLLLDDVVNK